MSRPSLLLIFLLIVAVVAGVLLDRVHDANTGRPKEPIAKSNEDVATPPKPPPPLAEVGDGELESILLNEAYQISKARGLAYQDALKFQPNSATGIQKAWQGAISSRFPGDLLNRLGLSLQLVGILPSDEDLVARYRLSANLSPDVLYDPQEGELLHHEKLNAEDPETKEWLAHHLALMLLDQNFHWREAQLPIEVNMDEALAQRALRLGDATWQTLKHTKTDAKASHIWKRTDSQTNNWPPPLREAEFLGLREAVHFCQSLTGQGMVLDSIYQQLPTCTAHLIHPDRYLEIPRWQPRRLQWAQLDIQRSEPVWDNVVGELMIRAWLKRALSAEDASLLASAWEGDGALLYQTDTDAPQLVWKSLWRTEERARRFYEVLSENATALFEVDSTAPEAADQSVTFPGLLQLKLAYDGETVTMLRTTEATWLEALEDVARRSAFTEKKP